MPRIERDPAAPHKMKVYDDEDGTWLASGHEEIDTVPDWPMGIVRRERLMFVLDSRKAVDDA